MHYGKHFFNWAGIICLCCGASFAAQGNAALQPCLDQGKQFFADKEYEKAAQQFETCVKIAPAHTETRLSLAGVYLTQNNLPAAKENFTQALQTMEKNSPYRSYTYSMLGDIALKEQQTDTALEMYQKSLQSNVANVNSLVGKGIILESRGQKKEAAQSYQSALAVEPLNLIARKRLINLEPVYFTDEEILTALKQRYAIEPTTQTLTDEQRALFSKIHLTEQRRGVDYLKSKFSHLPPNYTVTLNKDTDFAREILTLNGYQAVQDTLGKEAISTFQKTGVAVKDLFELRNQKGAPVFDKDSHLTPAGYYVYLDVLKGKKSYLLPNQDVPPTPEKLKKVEEAATRLKEDGFIEISFNELKKLEKETLCSQDTLKNKMGVKFLPITKSRFRFFVQSKDQEEPIKGVPYYYVIKNRAKRDPSLKVPHNSLVDSLQYFGGSTVCLEDGNPLY